MKHRWSEMNAKDKLKYEVNFLLQTTEKQLTADTIV